VLPFGDRVFAGVVGGQRLHDGAAVAVEQAAQEGRTERDVDRGLVQPRAIGRRPVGGPRQLAGGRGHELHQPVGIGRRHRLGVEEALLPDEREHQERVEATRGGLGADLGPVAERVEIAAQRARRVRSHLQGEPERRAGGSDRAVGLEQPVAVAGSGRKRLLRLELEAREAGQGQPEEQAGALAVRPAHMGGEGRLTGGGHRRRGCRAPETGLGDRRVVRRRMPIGDVHEPGPRLGFPPEPLEGAGVPVLGGDARAAGAARGEPLEPARGAHEVTGQVAHPSRPPAGLGGERRARIAGGELDVGRVRCAVAFRLLMNAADRV